MYHHIGFVVYVDLTHRLASSLFCCETDYILRIFNSQDYSIYVYDTTFNKLALLLSGIDTIFQDFFRKSVQAIYQVL